MTSSAGWKSSRTRPGSRPRAAPRPARGRRRPGPRCARRAHTRGPRRSTVLRPGVLGEVLHRQRVHVGPQRDHRARRCRGRRSPRCRCGRVTGQPACLDAGRHEVRRCVLSLQDSSGWACRSRRRSTRSRVVLVDDVGDQVGGVAGHRRKVSSSGGRTGTATDTTRPPAVQPAGVSRGQRRSGRDRHDLALGLLARQRR